LVWAKEAIEELGMKDDLIKSYQWEIAVGDINCEIEANDGQDVTETDEIELKQSKPSTTTDPSDDVFPTIPPEDLSGVPLC